MDNLTHSDEGLAPEEEGGATSASEAGEATRTPEHDALRAQDTIVGLRSEVETLKARLRELESTDVGIAFARVDQLEEEREASLRELRLLLKDYREQQVHLEELLSLNLEQDGRLQELTRTEAAQRDQIESVERAIASVKASSTWRLGSVLIRPISKVTGRLPR